MKPCLTARRSMLLAGTIAGLLTAATAFAQQPPAASRATRRGSGCRARRAGAAARLAADRPA